jgi:hypothetical protein
MTYVRGKAQPLTIEMLQRQIHDLLRERASHKQTIKALSDQVKALNAIPVNVRRAEPVCGTYSGYQKHIRNKEETCFPCRSARAEYTRQYRKLRACG